MKFQAINDLKMGIRSINLDVISERALERNQSEISELNRGQLEQGITSTGGFLPDYSPVSVQMFGKPEGPIKLKDTGDYYEGIVPRFDFKSFTLNGTDEKTDMLQKKYGKYGDPIGLTDESKGELAQIILPDVLDELREKI